MGRSLGEKVESETNRTVKRRLFEVGVGLGIVLLAILGTKIWVELKNVRRADSAALRQSVALTLEAVQEYNLDRAEAKESVEPWVRFLQTSPKQKIPASPAHEFLDSFVIYYQDGKLDSAEAGVLYDQLAGFSPDID